MNKTILITGANKGIGFEVARQLGHRGWKVILSARNKEKMNQAVTRLQSEGSQVSGLLMDVTDPESIRRAAHLFAASGTRLDVLMNNAAILLKSDRSILENSEEDFYQTLQTNSYGPLRVTQAFLPYMHAPGRIIHISSGGGSMSDPVGGWAPAYCVSKTLLNALTRQMAHELAPKGIGVYAACPGWVKTDMGGAGATRPVEKGAETPVWLATTEQCLPTGRFFRDCAEITW